MANEIREEYEVGHGKPPKGTRFKKGQSGNPKGRPKGSQNLSTILQQILKERVKITENGRVRKTTKAEAIFLQATNKAMAGKGGGFNDLLNALKAFGMEQPDDTVVPAPRERDKKVMVDLLRRLRESDAIENIQDAEPEENQR